jgi:integrase
MAVHKKGNRWVADFYLGGRNGRRVRRSAPTRKLAEAVESDAKLRELRSELGADEIKSIGLKGFIKHYKELHSPTKTPTSRTRDIYTFKHILRIFGDPPLTRIRRENVERYAASRSKTVSKSTVNRELDLLKSLFNRAVEWGYLKTSPAVGVKRYKLDEQEPCFLTSTEGRALMDVATGQMRTFLVTALNTGLRKGELFALKWKDIDFEREELRVRRSKGKRFRVIPLNDLALQTLREHPRHISSLIVFHNPDGSCWKDVRGSFNATLTKAGLPRIRIHDLRHSFISNLVMAGEDLRTVQELAGHRSITTTMRYAHLAPGRLKDSVTKLKWEAIEPTNPSILLK